MAAEEGKDAEHNNLQLYGCVVHDMLPTCGLLMNCTTSACK